MMQNSQSHNDKLTKHKQELMQILKKYLPEAIVMHCTDIIIQYNLHLHISESRKSKLGDYHPYTGKGNHITINHDLNPFHFLITFMHELAHHTTYKKYKHKHEPHGKEWKEEFKSHMRYPLMAGIFPPDIVAPLIKHMQNPSFTHTGDVHLMKALIKHDKHPATLLDDLQPGDFFSLQKQGKSIMQKGEKRRVYHLCTDVANGKKYLVKGIAAVNRISMPSKNNR